MTAKALRSNSIFQGRYLFHVHTWATDGKLNVDDYFRFARDRGIDRIIFLEHIRRVPTYDVDAYVTAVKAGSHEFGVSALAGFETKILPDGSLDIDEKHANAAEALGIAEHSFAGDSDQLAGALTACFLRYDRLRAVRGLVWVHPGLYFKKHGLLEKERSRYRDLLNQAVQAGVPPERNMRYDLVSQPVFAELDPACRVVGADAHSADDLERYVNWFPAQQTELESRP